MSWYVHAHVKEGKKISAFITDQFIWLVEVWVEDSYHTSFVHSTSSMHTGSAPLQILAMISTLSTLPMQPGLLQLSNQRCL